MPTLNINPPPDPLAAALARVGAAALGPCRDRTPLGRCLGALGPALDRRPLGRLRGLDVAAAPAPPPAIDLSDVIPDVTRKAPRGGKR